MKTSELAKSTSASPSEALARLIKLEVWCSREQAAELLAISLSQLDRLIATNQLPAFKIGRRVLITAWALERFIDSYFEDAGVQ